MKNKMKNKNIKKNQSKKHKLIFFYLYINVTQVPDYQDELQ